jgi:transcriptional regulator with XRE-family HTH domain
MFAQRIKKLREEHRYTQRYVAEMCDISKSAIDAYEKGIRKPKLEAIEAIADLYNVDVDYLLGKTDIPNAYQANKNAPGENNLTEGEIAWLELYRMMPDEQTRAILVNMVEQFTALSEDAQALVLRLLQRDTTN